MRELTLSESNQVSGGKHISFFCSYALGQNGYDAYSAIAISSVIGVACALPALPVVSTSGIVSMATMSVVNSTAGFYFSVFVNKPSGA